jgi:phosphoenolpyruvate carboxykinase (diphosphate)
VEAQTRVASQYFEDGSVEAACPPLQALLHIMARGGYRGKPVEDAAVRGLFTREYLMASDWYRERLRTKQMRDTALWTRHLRAIERFQSSGNALPAGDIDSRLSESRKQLARVSASEYLKELEGTIGADPFCGAAQ